MSGHTHTQTEASNSTDELYKRSEIRNEQQNRKAPDKFSLQQMELPSKIIKQMAFNARSKSEEHMSIVMDKSTPVEHLFQQLQTNNKMMELAVTFLTGFNEIFSITSKNNKLYFTLSINDKDFNQLTISTGAYEIQSLNIGIKRNNFEEGYFTEANYPFTIKLIFSTLGSIIEISSNISRSQIVLTPDDSIRDP